MKKIIFILAFAMAASTCVEGHNFYNKHVTISVQTFYDELQPFGDWINTPEYGYVWRPYLDDPDGFRPYATGGNWVYTDLGWTWVSDYRWGWAAFHYGRWYFDDYLGWMWIPGNEWAPAWVTWGSYDNYWAWAPMGPNMHVSVNFNWIAPHFWWTFVPQQHFCSNNWYAHIYNPRVQINNITYITNIYNGNNYRQNHGNWFHGPRVRDVERHLNKRVQRMQVTDTDRPDRTTARDNRVHVYRPGVANSRESVRPANYRDAVNLRSDKQIQRSSNENVARTAKTNARETTRKSVNRTLDRQRENMQRTDASRQQTIETNRNATPRSTQTVVVARNTAKSAPVVSTSPGRTTSNGTISNRTAPSRTNSNSTISNSTAPSRTNSNSTISSRTTSKGTTPNRNISNGTTTNNNASTTAKESKPSRTASSQRAGTR